MLSFIIIFYRPLIPILRSAEIEFYGYSAGFKRIFFGYDNDKPTRDEILFVNTGYSNELAPDKDSYGNEAIVDRKVLGECFKKLKTVKDSIKLIICDIDFPNITSNDSAWLKEVDGLKGKILFPKTSNSLYSNRIESYSASATKIHSILVQYPLIYNDTVTLPLSIYQKLHPNAQIKLYPSYSPFVNIDGNIFPKSVIIEPRFRAEHLEKSEEDSSKYKVEHLNSFVKYFSPESLINKIIIFGNFNDDGNDKHQTILTDTFGPLAILNTYLMIENQDSEISASWFMFMFISLFTFFTWRQTARFDYFKSLSLTFKKHKKNTYERCKLLFKNILWLNKFLMNIYEPVFPKIIYLKQHFKIRYNYAKKQIGLSEYFIDLFKSLRFVTIVALVSYTVFGFHIEYIFINFIILFESFLYFLALFIFNKSSKRVVL